jgi:chitosanase
MELGIKNIIVQTINCFETGKPQGDYGNVSVYCDGKNPRTGLGFWQITYGRSQTTEQGKLKQLLEFYVKNQGEFAAEIAIYLPTMNKTLVNSTKWADNRSVQDLLKKMGSDPIMRSTQDTFFDIEYFQPAMEWAEKNEFILPLSKLVIYDSFIHSGKILDFLREKFEEVPPQKGGNEQKWITEYLFARYRWLKGHRNPILRITSGRVWQLMLLVKAENWLLTQSFKANGNTIDGYNG